MKYQAIFFLKSNIYDNNNKKYFKMLSVAVVIGTLLVKQEITNKLILDTPPHPQGPKCNGQMDIQVDNMKTVYPIQTQFQGWSN